MKNFKFWFYTALYFLLMIADGVLTYINTPDLAMEGNPLVAKLGLGWGALAIANILVFALFILCAYYCFVKYETIYTNETKMTTYWSQITFGRPDMFWKGGFLLPKYWSPVISASGFAIVYGLISGRMVLVTEWLAETFNSFAYYRFESTYCFGRTDVVVGLVVAIFFFFYWMHSECKKQLKKEK